MRYASPIPQPTPQERARFQAKYERPEIGCWEWQAAIADGYGRFRMRGKTWRAHRLSFAWEYPEIDISERDLDHIVCDNPRCVRPSHLAPSTIKDNVLRGAGPSARNARLDKCRRGHEFTEENTYVDKRGKRNCRECWRINKREDIEKNRDRINARKRKAYKPVSYPPRKCKTCGVEFVPARSTNWYHSRECQENRPR